MASSDSCSLFYVHHWSMYKTAGTCVLWATLPKWNIGIDKCCSCSLLRQTTKKANQLWALKNRLSIALSIGWNVCRLDAPQQLDHAKTSRVWGLYKWQTKIKSKPGTEGQMPHNLICNMNPNFNVLDLYIWLGGSVEIRKLEGIHERWGEEALSERGWQNMCDMERVYVK